MSPIMERIKAVNFSYSMLSSDRRSLDVSEIEIGSYDLHTT